MLRPAIVLLALFTVLTGAVYPFAVTGVAKVLFPRQAEGSLLREGDEVVGSSLIGQSFSDAGEFWGRPSATAPFPYNAAASTGSNLGPLNPALADAVKERIAKLRRADPEQQGPIPADLVTTSASGLDPDISPEAAQYQVHRVAKARGLPEAEVEALVEAHVQRRAFGVLGEPTVNVLLLNLDLNRLAASRPPKG